ncbi:transcription initiation factor TFIID subunit 7 [Condylostylus longicornis]|uniref:transcription initiation factor TFIID subunit 7 n=1 Tax=Condylostylus longicornis TaxID=2530218 RepID=UPI00244DEC69|nr:transcription initiation factor TFIID subunit 7 [Condylostylus longicornis]
MKPAEVKKDDPVELETQFILRIPEEPAKVLHEAIQSGSNLKDRLSIKLENDVRYGEVRFDHWLLHAKVLDLPTIIESLKTIDSKSFYKTADICQIMICKEEPDSPQEEESPNKAKKKDPNKVDKKFLWPHGVTPPCKNVRKRRFRKTLKKKYVEAPEIEKEVKRLLRIDNDAVSVKYEVINEDDENIKSDQLDNNKEPGQNETDDDKQDENMRQDQQVKRKAPADSDEDGEANINQPLTPRGLAEQDIFGGEVSSSSSDEEETRISRNMREIQENSRFSAEDSRISEYSVSGARGVGNDGVSGGPNEEGESSRNGKNVVTEFDKTMFNELKDSSDGPNDGNDGAMSSEYFDQQKDNYSDFEDLSEPHLSKDEIKTKILDLRQQCDELKNQQNQKQTEISSIQNPTLKQRLQDVMDNLLSQIVEKELQIQEYQNMLQKVANE